MCPGGIVVPAASEEGMVAVNGMSYHDRAGTNANSAIVLMHIAYQKTVDALPEMIETLKSRGYDFKTVPEMLP